MSFGKATNLYTPSIPAVPAMQQCRRLLLLSGLCGLCLSGCGGSDGPQRHALRGAVAVEGIAVAEGTISFLPAAGNGAQPAHTTIEDGEYRFSSDDGPFSGPHRVVIGIIPPPDVVGSRATDETETGGQGIKEVAAPRPPTRFQKPPAPKKLQWEIEYTVPEDGNDTKDFDVSG